MSSQAAPKTDIPGFEKNTLETIENFIDNRFEIIDGVIETYTKSVSKR